MCGIAGIFSFNNSAYRVDETLLASMRDTMVHRGPDGSGLWISTDKQVGLAHRRLSIIDLSDAARQPMTNEDGSLWISFNGEIYNHQELRAELEQLGGHRWSTDHSDTEVILHAFEQWGIDCLQRFRGMFAFALWDGRSRELWLVRDRIGVKPLYYSVHHGRVTFASEIKALLKDPQQKREVDDEAFYHYLSFLTTPAPQTMFAGIKKIPGGTWLRIKEDGSIREERYWDVWTHAKPLTSLSEDEIAEKILSELRTAVQYRKVSDVPVGVFLSGGIDSSTNAALFSEGEGAGVKTFSIGYQGDYQSCRNELDYARKMANTVGAQYHEKLLSLDHLIDFLPEMVRLQDEPIADPVCVPVYYVSRLARDNGVVVCQVGEGADELFWGYPAWKRALKLQRIDDLPFPRFAKKLGLLGLKFLGREYHTYYEWLRRGSEGQPVFWGGAEAFTELEKRRLLSPQLNKRLAGLTSWEAIEPIYRRFQEQAWEKTPLNWMSYLDLNLRLPELLLMRVDKMSMGVSLECRVPFLDHKFVELAMGIPESLKTKNGILKYILKKSVRGVIPDEMIDRKKQGFGVPVYEWFFDELGDKTSKIISTFCEQTDFLNPEAVSALVATRSHQVWYLLNFALWWHEFINDDPEDQKKFLWNG
ncbi:MAG: asparagine synthase (glutamine-hydrolyzing) [Desulfobulbaceae bacterium]|nr:asparagine synthase (glutamine-hydrolyzing) [Desulfobulbaceae bacterium]